jgi:uncharacterized protein (UPF0333 family)
MISNKYLLLFIFIVLSLIFGGYYFSKNLNKSLTSTAPNKKPTQPPTEQTQTKQASTTLQIYLLWMMIAIWLFEIFSIIYNKKNTLVN